MKLQNVRIKCADEKEAEGSTTASFAPPPIACGLLIKDTYKLAEIYRLRFTGFITVADVARKSHTKNENFEDDATSCGSIFMCMNLYRIPPLFGSGPASAAASTSHPKWRSPPLRLGLAQGKPSQQPTSHSPSQSSGLPSALKAMDDWCCCCCCFHSQWVYGWSVSRSLV